MPLRTPSTIRLLGLSFKHSWDLPRKKTQLMLGFRRWAGQWPKGCSIVWLTKDDNAFMARNLTLIPEQKRELESDLVQESFLKDF